MPPVQKNQPKPVSTAPARRASPADASNDTVSVREVFSFHGIWGFGVRRMRSMQFVAKAILISVLFAVPIVLLGYYYLGTKADVIAFSAKERVGVAYIRDVMPLLRAAQADRSAALQAAKANSAPDGSARSAARTAATKLEATHRNLAAELEGIGPFFDKTKQAAAAVESAQGVAKVYEAHTAYINSLLVLILEATDRSNLTLDPDLDSYFVMDALSFRVPGVAETLASLRDLSVEGVGSVVGAEVAMRKEMSEQVPVAKYNFDSMVAGLSKSLGANASLKGTLRWEEAQKPTEDAITALQTHFRSSETTALENAAPRDMLERALNAQHDLANRLLADLDKLLVARLDGFERERRMVVIVGVIALVLAVYFFYAFYLVMSGGLREVARHLVAITDGDLTTRPRPWGKDEPARLMLTLRVMQDSLQSLVSEVRHAAREIGSASGEISSGSIDLSQRTEQNAASLEQSASAVEEISVTSRNAADNVREVAAIASGNAAVAQKAGQSVHQVVATMQAIHASSSKINDIIGTIDSIAFQTNILALNAAVEAARAGEQGRGFAVVASEVRALAQRSAAAAREIKDLISTSVAQINDGTAVVEKAGSTIEEVVSNAQRINTLLSDVATSSREQAEGVSQVGESIQNLDRSTQQNAALVEQTSAAASALADQAQALVGKVDRFRLP
jgi:methyl-accepting chemotaxis protein